MLVDITDILNTSDETDTVEATTVEVTTVVTVAAEWEDITPEEASTVQCTAVTDSNLCKLQKPYCLFLCGQDSCYTMLSTECTYLQNVMTKSYNYAT